MFVVTPNDILWPDKNEDEETYIEYIENKKENGRNI